MEKFILDILNTSGGTLPIWMFLLVFLGGVLSSLSPCTLGVLPIIVGYVGGNKENKSNKIAIQLFGFTMGLALVLTVLGVVSSMAGMAFGAHASPIWAVVIASFILLMGLSLLEVIEIPVPAVVKQMPQNNKNSLILYPVLLGGAYAFATSPCSTPILAAILAFTSFKANIALGAILLFLFSLGQSTILIFAGLFTSFLKKISIFKTLSVHFMKFSGIILIVASALIYVKVFNLF